MHKLVNVLTIAIILLFSQNGSEAFVNLKVYENDWLKKIVNEPSNDVHVRPTILNTSEPAEITVSLLATNFDLDDKKQEFTLDLTLIQEWEDDRLAYAKYNPVQLRQIKHLTLLDTSKIWNPDTFWKNFKRGYAHSQTKPNTFGRIYSNGTVILNSRMTITLACPVNLRYFPFDDQICSMQMASYAFARDDLIFKWKPVAHPIIVRTDSSPEFAFTGVSHNYCDSKTLSGVYSCLVAEFSFKRSSRYYLIKMFIPMTNFAIVGWLSFLLSPQSEKTFLLRGLLCLSSLSLAFMKLSNAGAILPRPKYTTAFDWWNGITLTFIFYALLEFIVVHYLSTHNFGREMEGETASRNSKRNSSLEDIELSRTKIEGSLTIEPENVEVERKKSVEVQTHWTKKLIPENIEKWSIILYPSFFIFFNFIFWIVCSSSGGTSNYAE